MGLVELLWECDALALHTEFMTARGVMLIWPISHLGPVPVPVYTGTRVNKD